MNSPIIKTFFDQSTYTFSYVVHGAPEGPCAIIDPVLDFDAKAARISTTSAQLILDYIAELNLSVEWILETHAHADHLSAAHWLKQQAGGNIAIGEGITGVQAHFSKLFNLGPEFVADGSQFDYLFQAGERLAIGSLECEVLFTPGHTPACVSYKIADAVFVGDTLFTPDYGTARADFPGGDAQALYRSIQQLLSLPAETRLFMCHDYLPNGRAPKWETTVAEQRKHNLMVHQGVSEADFVAARHAKDASLAAPVLILPALQVNIRAGQLPPAESNGTQYLKLPINRI
ncbi:MBL fold metallo-hydrolase [Ketobacter alkanivorans]|uniref:MBL fold metallo-hydrolase n=1 Tax=Ketobacter alkanivorans TaxID=1917421 RepID=A0A2K9LN31_9GAMM|nr:MBL fold metallo-hydrolase [Ketobacter alkanivorans]AUM13647.1 MBL fold metallo-hydrolase [Ketobacter alkanivorans]